MTKSKTKTIYTCQNCGAQRPRYEGRCSECGAWNTFVEEVFSSEPKVRGWSVKEKGSGKLELMALDQSPEEQSFQRWNTGIGELNRVLGGGLVKGGFVLLGGSPGIGKSTLLLQMAGGLASNPLDVLYISGEESVSQTVNRAQRLGIRTPKCEIGNESNLEIILSLAKQKKPNVLIVDSIQTVFLPNLEAAPGSVSQVRECSGHLLSLAKTEGISVLIIGHVTKEGTLAGPKVLEHMVDCVLSFDGDLSNQFRLLRSLKNRYGPTHELGVFRMSHRGLDEVANPSEFFLEERGASMVGSAVFASIEGTRPLLCEVQALTVSSPMPNPRRTALGIELNRLHMISAVLDRHAGLKLAHNDIFINVVGGLKLVEPSSDLAVAAAILSTDLDRALDSKSVFMGEIGLTGEVRAVTFADQRLREADKLGFQHFVLPFSNKRSLEDFKVPQGKKITWIKNVAELRNLLAGRVSKASKPIVNEANAF